MGRVFVVGGGGGRVCSLDEPSEDPRPRPQSAHVHFFLSSDAAAPEVLRRYGEEHLVETLGVGLGREPVPQAALALVGPRARARERDGRGFPSSAFRGRTPEQRRGLMGPQPGHHARDLAARERVVRRRGRGHERQSAGGDEVGRRVDELGERRQEGRRGAGRRRRRRGAAAVAALRPNERRRQQRDVDAPQRVPSRSSHAEDAKVARQPPRDQKGPGCRVERRSDLHRGRRRRRRGRSVSASLHHLLEGALGPVVPPAGVQSLSQKLAGRLRAVLVERGGVEVVDEVGEAAIVGRGRRAATAAAPSAASAESRGSGPVASPAFPLQRGFERRLQVRGARARRERDEVDGGRVGKRVEREGRGGDRAADGGGARAAAFLLGSSAVAPASAAAADKHAPPAAERLPQQHALPDPGPTGQQHGEPAGDQRAQDVEQPRRLCCDDEAGGAEERGLGVVCRGG